MVSSLTKEDISKVINLGTFLNPKFCELFHIEDLKPYERIYIYKETKEVLGFIHISIHYEVVDLLNIVVDESHRNKGIATILMDYMISSLPSNVEKIILEVNENNIEAIKLYNKFNFNIINIRKNYYGQDNALIMERNLK